MGLQCANIIFCLLLKYMFAFSAFKLDILGEVQLKIQNKDWFKKKDLKFYFMH